jgi:hypothetical protein
MEGDFSPASLFDCATIRGVQHNNPTKIVSHKRFDISTASKFARFKLAEEFYTKSIECAQNPASYRVRDLRAHCGKVLFSGDRE